MHLFGTVYVLALLALLVAIAFLARSGWIAGRGNSAGGLVVAAAVIEAMLVFGEILFRIVVPRVLPRVMHDVDGMDLTLVVLDFYVPTAAALHAIAIGLVAIAVRKMASPPATTDGS